jgi:hypothetical protein
MKMQSKEFYAHNSPWTEMYDKHCQQEDTDAAGWNAADEQVPTLNALGDVYNREDDADTYHKRV